jgi:hypothetical protein
MFSLPTLANFLASIPPGKEEIVSDVVRQVNHRGTDYGSVEFNATDISIDCSSDTCDGVRIFECVDVAGLDGPLLPDTLCYCFLYFRCRNCRKSFKTIAIKFTCPQQGNLHCAMVKLGEDPTFGSCIPSRVITLVGPDRDVFLKGRRCENQGLGIGAFAYYRRVIENQKNRLFDEIIMVANSVGAQKEQIQALEVAKSETQFSRAVESAKAVIPRELFIQGRNPLSLLHGALSEGLHALSDDQCLELATSIREVLFELAERVGQVLKEQKSLNAAIAQLAHRSTP